jgi:rhodanese-related sulfurtransferase
MPRNNRVARRGQTTRLGISFLPWLFIGLAVVMVGAGIFLVVRSSGGSPSGQISVAQAYQDYRGGALVLDVRTKDEWNQSHIAGAILIPLDELGQRLGEVPHNQEVILVCQTGVRSAQALQILDQAGFANAASMTGGLEAWTAAGYPTTTNQ